MRQPFRALAGIVSLTAVCYKGTINPVELVGWVEPEQRFIPSGVAVCTFRVATKRPSERNEAGEGAYDTDWTRIEAWEKLAKHCAQSLHEDSRVR